MKGTFYAVLFFQHLDANFKGKISLTSGQKWPNFGAKWAQLQKPDKCLLFRDNFLTLKQKCTNFGTKMVYLWGRNGLTSGQKEPNFKSRTIGCKQLPVRCRKNNTVTKPKLRSESIVQCKDYKTYISLEVTVALTPFVSFFWIFEDEMLMGWSSLYRADRQA